MRGLTYDNGKDMAIKINRFERLSVTISRTLRKKKACKKMEIRFYMVMAVPTLLYGLECWVDNQQGLKAL